MITPIKMLTLEKFAFDQFKGNPTNYNEAKMIVNRIKKDSFDDISVLTTRGDGNCLIRSIIAHLFVRRSKDVLFEILLPICGDENIGELCEFTNETSVVQAMQKSIVDVICVRIRDTIKSTWKQNYKGDYSYHMSDDAIDGLALQYVMRLLGVNELKIYSLKPEKNSSFLTVIETGDLISPVTPWTVTLICAQGRCHYSALL